MYAGGMPRSVQVRPSLQSLSEEYESTPAGDLVGVRVQRPPAEGGAITSGILDPEANLSTEANSLAFYTYTMFDLTGDGVPFIPHVIAAVEVAISVGVVSSTQPINGSTFVFLNNLGDGVSITLMPYLNPDGNPEWAMTQVFGSIF